ncbi:unnamed protein product, partial [Mesorhabditis spiculigera]
MFFDKIPYLSDFRKTLKRHVLDDAVDSLHYSTTAEVLVFFAVLISAKQAFGHPIDCWTPAEFSGAWKDYTNSYCFTSNTYFIKANETDSIDSPDRGHDSRISYYQWVPFLLALQALCFYLPNWLWKRTTSAFGIDLEHCVLEAQKMKNMSRDKRAEKLDEVAATLSEALGLHDVAKFKRRNRCFGWRADYLSHSLTTIYFLTKLLYIGNILLQIFILGWFLGRDWTHWGLLPVLGLIQGQDWSQTGLFPRVTFCDFAIHSNGALVERTVQCVLMINMYNEKIFLVLWCLFCILLGLTVLNTLIMMVNHVFHFRKAIRVRRWLKYAPGFQRSEAARFSREVLKSDGYLALCFIERHAGLPITREIADVLWTHWTSHNEDLVSLVTLQTYTPSIDPRPEETTILEQPARVTAPKKIRVRVPA